MLRVRHLLPLAALAALLGAASPGHAQTIIDEWPSIKAPPAPELTAVTIDPKTTALLELDFIKQTCNNDHRPRCVASLPKAKKFLDAARAHGVFVVYSIIPGPATIADTLPEVAPKGNEPVVKSGVDKFLNTDLDKILKDHGITTVIINGTSAQGAIMYTGSEAVLRGYKVIVPVDGMSAENSYIEQYVAYNFLHAPIIAGNVTLTSYGMIKF
ncbi:MAG: isochorismatase family protein [Stellaceae bacterium]